MGRYGLAEIDITPPFQVELAGWHFGKSRGVLDDLRGQVFVLQSADGNIALIALDLIGLGHDHVQRIRSALASECSIATAFIACSHTHSGPAGFDFHGGWGRVHPEYVQLLQTRIIEGVQKALKNVFQGRIGFGSREIHGLTYCDQKRNRGGCIDPRLQVIRIDGEDGSIRGVLTNFGCHPVCLHGYGNLVSPDYPGYLRASLRETVGRDVVVGCLSGAFGDIMPTDFAGAGEGDLKLAERLGASLARETADVLGHIKTEVRGDARAGSVQAHVPLMRLSIKDLERRTKELQERLEGAQLDGPGKEACEAEIAWTLQAIHTQSEGREEQHIEMELQAIVIEEEAFLGIPMEPYAEFALAVARASPFEHTLVVGQANGAYGYLGTRSAYEDKAYTVGHACMRYGTPQLAPGAFEHLVRASGRLLVELRSVSRGTNEAGVVA